MKRLFLTAEVQYVAQSIGAKLDALTKENAVFITTALKDKIHTNLEWHYENKCQMEKAGFHFDEYDITGKTNQELVSDLSSYAAMYIEGGNSFFLLQESQKNGFGEFVKKRVEEGMVYLSTSAGTVIAGPTIEPVYQESRAILAPDLNGFEGYRLVDFVVMPHWGQEKRRDLFNNYRVKHIYNLDSPYILLNNHQYVEVKDNNYRIIDIFKKQNMINE